MSDTFINEKTNDTFSNLRKNDLLDLLSFASDYYLEYRDSLNLPEELTFGTEIEYEGFDGMKTDIYVESNMQGWLSKKDVSLDSGGEVISPIMNDNIKYWKQLRSICNFLNDFNADTSRHAGGHVHIGANILGKDVDAWKQFLKLYTAYESVLFRFAYGDKINARRGMYKFATPMADALQKSMIYINKADSLYQLTRFLPDVDRFRALNLKNVNFHEPDKTLEKNTIEFRNPNASTDEVIWQNNINAFAKMLLSSSQKVMDEDFLDYKLEHEYAYYKDEPHYYIHIDLKKALEFVDLVFDNNLDKIYFLRQYLKDFKEDDRVSKTIKSKKFVK